jgi:HAD superfamily hydrolase (TIGR01490 family)
MIAAIFDLDNTIVPGNSVERRFFYRLLREHRIGLRETGRMLGFLLGNLTRLSPTLLHTNKLYLAGKPVEEMERLATEHIAKEIVPRLSPRALDKLAQHRAAGHFLIVLTGCPDFLIAPLAPHLKVDAVVSGRLDRRAGRFTGAAFSPYPYGPGKRLLFDQIVATYGIDPAQSYAYADRLSDLEFLSAVRYPAAVNPGPRLARIAKNRGWEVYHW